MTVKIYHNPRCSKSRQTLEIIRAAGAEPEIIEYLEAPPTARDIAALVQALGIAPQDLLRRGEEPYKTLGLGAPGKKPQELIDAMAAHPILIERPIVVTDKGVRVCRPPETVKEIL